jgi:hypothetical protein
VPGEPDRLGGIRGSGLRDHRHAGGLVDDGLHDQAALVAAQRGELAGGAARHDPVHSSLGAAEKPVEIAVSV